MDDSTSKQKRKPFFSFHWLITLIILGVILTLGIISRDYALQYEKNSRTIAELSQTGTKTKNSIKHLFENISLGLYKGYSENQINLENLNKEREKIKQPMQVYTSVLFLIIVVWLLFTYRYSARQIFLLSTIIISAFCLLLGITTPILSLATTGNLPVIGETILQYNSKSIISSVSGLYHSGNYFVGSLILLFSVVVPIFKTGIFMIASVKESFTGKALVKWLKNTGKWSMVDVMIVSLLLAFFAIDGEQMTKAQMQSGVYFFSAYVILSIISSHFISHKGTDL